MTTDQAALEAQQRDDITDAANRLAEVSGGKFTLWAIEWSPGLVVVSMMTPDGLRSFAGYESSRAILEDLVGMYTISGKRRCKGECPDCQAGAVVRDKVALARFDEVNVTGDIPAPRQR